MTNDPDPVARITADYLDRVRYKLGYLAAHEQDEFVRELQSHIYEAYRQTSECDEIGAILAVLRNLGEPAEVVSDRLPAAMVRSGTRRRLPLYVLAGIVVALFGIPLGFGGFAVVIGLLTALAELLIAYYVIAGSLLLAGGVVSLLGLTRILLPEFWDKLVAAGFIHIEGPLGDFLVHFSAFEQGLMLLLIASPLLFSGFGMLRLGKRLLRGLRFLFLLVFDWARRFAQSARRKLSRHAGSGHPVTELSFS